MWSIVYLSGGGGESHVAPGPAYRQAGRGGRGGEEATKKGKGRRRGRGGRHCVSWQCHEMVWDFQLSVSEDEQGCADKKKIKICNFSELFLPSSQRKRNATYILGGHSDQIKIWSSMVPYGPEIPPNNSFKLFKERCLFLCLWTRSLY